MKSVKVLVTIPELEGQQEFLDEIAAVSPSVAVEQQTCRTFDETAELLEGVEVLYTWQVPSHVDRADCLKWVQIHAAGIDGKSFSPIFEPSRGITVTNMAGAQAVSIAEYCMTMMSFLSRGFLQLFRDMQSKVSDRQHSPPVELCGQTIGILGYGHIGREVARMAHANRMRILAMKRDPRKRQAVGCLWPGFGDPEGSLPEKIFGPDHIREMLPQCDFIVCCLPSTAESRGLIGDEEFACCQPHAWMVNVGRGDTIGQDALVNALENRTIAGAALDVFPTDPGPLPPEHPIWELDNVFLSPHVSGTRRNRQYLVRTNQVFCENLRRYLDGQPLLNVTSIERGY